MADQTYELIEPEDEPKPEDGLEPEVPDRFAGTEAEETATESLLPAPAKEPPKPLPRLVRFSSPEDEDAAPRHPPKSTAASESRPKPGAEPPPKRPKSKPPAPPRDEEPPPRRLKPKPPAPPRDEPSEKTGALNEQTPELDTYETRSKIRLALGLGMVVVLGMLFLFVIRPHLGSGSLSDEEEANLAPADPIGVSLPTVSTPRTTVATAPGQTEREARLVLDDARAFARKSDADNTLRRLRSVIEHYPQSAAAKEAQTALDRTGQGLPLFVDIPLVLPRGVEPTPSPEPTPKPSPSPVAEVTPTPTPPPGPARPVLPPPPVTPEPYVETGLILERAEVLPKPLPDGFRIRPETGIHPTGWPLEITCDRDGAAMVLIPGGTFHMGRNDGPPSERPAHKVTLSPYYIDQHEITVRQYRIFAHATGRRLPREFESDSQMNPNLPMVQVSARDAKDYADWAEKALPTEAQWEFAARTIDGRIHPWGIEAPEWQQPRSPGQIDPAMSFPLDLSPFGVFDLAGNAREWTADWYDPRYYQALARAETIDPLGPPRGSARLPSLAIKGGSPDWNSAWRADMRPEARLPDLGFRCVLWLTPKPTAATPTPTPGMPNTAPGGLVPF